MSAHDTMTERPGQEIPVNDDDRADPPDQDAGTGTTRVGTGRWLLLALALVIGASGAWAWRSAATNDELARAEARDSVLVAAERTIETLTTLDYREVDAGIREWADASTGTLADQLAGIGRSDRRLLADQQKISTGEVVRAAVVDLDQATATVIAAVEVTVVDDADPQAEPVVKRNRYTADLTKVQGEWKLESLQQVEVNLQ